MKKNVWTWMLAAGMVLAGCSDEMDEGGGGNGVVDGVTGYVQLALNLPTAGMSTRAANDNFDDGLADEYKVNNGIIAFFTGATTGTDEDATFVKAYALEGLENWTPVGTTTDQITTKKVVVSEAPMVAEGNTMYALVFLNPNGVVSSTNNGLTINGTSLTAGTSKLADVRKFIGGQAVETYTGDDEDSFFMSNAPLASTETVDGTSSVKVQTLVPVTVYPTEAEAEGATNPDEIYVERAVGKVTLDGFTYDETGDKYTITVDGDNNIYEDDVVTLEGWTLNMTNKSTAVVRDVTGASTIWANYKTTSDYAYFFGSLFANIIGANQYRIYWAVDNNYDSDDITSDGFNVYDNTTSDESISWNTDAETDDASHPLYCLENTMDATLAQADPAPITYVLLKTKYDFGEGDDGTSFFVVTNAPTKGTMTESDFESYVNGQMGYTNDNSSAVSVSESAEGGTYDTADEIKTLFNLTGDDADTKAAAILAKIGTIKFYENGTTYYYASYIKHFGDTYTLDPRDPNVAATNKIDAECLGYYGVVRNNWYELNITGISGPGEPEITPPSDNYGYVSVSINVLSWAKRTQDVEL